MNITIFGTGYVGLVSLACFAELGHNVTGIDVSKQKIDNLKLNQLPIFEKGLKKLILSNREKKEFHTILIQLNYFQDLNKRLLLLHHHPKYEVHLQT